MIEEIQNVKDKYNLSYRYLEKLGLEFKWVSKYLQNEITKEVMIERLNLEIGQYAKRQVAWFKRYTN
jgi:tRNA dimethylallyltransferase